MWEEESAVFYLAVTPWLHLSLAMKTRARFLFVMFAEDLALGVFVSGKITSPYCECHDCKTSVEEKAPGEFMREKCFE